MEKQKKLKKQKMKKDSEKNVENIITQNDAKKDLNQLPTENKNQEVKEEKELEENIIQNNTAIPLSAPETQFIKIKQNENLKKAGNKMKSIFESDDEEESKPKNIVDKTKDLTLKLSTFGIISNPPPTNNIQKTEDNKPKPKKAEAERLKKEEEEKRAAFRAKGVCQYCGGEFKKGFLSTKCTACGKRKDY